MTASVSCMIALVRGVGRFKEASPPGPLQFRSFQNQCRIFADAIPDFARFSERSAQPLRWNAGKHSEKNNSTAANFTAGLFLEDSGGACSRFRPSTWRAAQVRGRVRRFPKKVSRNSVKRKWESP